MCTRVSIAPIDPAAPLWIRSDVTIAVSDRLSTEQVLFQVRAMLMWLGAPQGDEPATCWCGDPVKVPGVKILQSAGAVDQTRERVRGA